MAAFLPLINDTAHLLVIIYVGEVIKKLVLTLMFYSSLKPNTH